jgi:uncharacterized protein (DUF58 family)
MKLNMMLERKATKILQGLQKSKVKDMGFDFAFLRDYSPGDDYRRIDWKAVSRDPTKLFVREFESTKETDVVIMLDLSESMGSGDVITKIDYAIQAIVLLSFLVPRQQDNLTYLSFAEDVVEFHKPSKSKNQYFTILQSMARARTEGTKNYYRAMQFLTLYVTKRALVFLFTDLQGGEDEIYNALKYAKSKGHEIVIVHLFDPYFTKITLPKTGRPEDKSDQKLLDVLSDAVKEELEEKYDNLSRKLRKLGVKILRGHPEKLVNDLLYAYVEAKRKGLAQR